MTTDRHALFATHAYLPQGWRRNVLLEWNDEGVLTAVSPDTPPPAQANRIRAAVERSIAHLVNWKVLDTGWRGRLTDFPDFYAPLPDRTWG